MTRFAEQDHIPVVRFTKADRKIDGCVPIWRAQAKTGRSGVAAIGIAQEYASVFTGTQREGSNGTPWFAFHKADRRVTCYYFYLWDADFGPAFIKICAYFPYPAKIWINGHEWAKRQAAKAGIGFTALDNGFAACDDPAGLQAICDRLGPAQPSRFRPALAARSCRCRSPTPIGPPATGRSCRSARSSSRAPWCSTAPRPPADSSSPGRATTSTSAAPTRSS